MKKLFGILIVALILCVLLAVIGSMQEVVLFSDLTDSQANSVLMVLKSNDIECHKAAGSGETCWNVVLSNEDDFTKAVSICEQNGVPKSEIDEALEATSNVIEKLMK